MKKTFLFVLLSLCLCCFLLGCNNDGYESRITDLRTDIFIAESDDFTLTAYMGRRETPFSADGMVGNVQNVMLIKLQTAVIAARQVMIDYDGKQYVADFTTHPTSHHLSAVIAFPPTQAETLNAKVVVGETAIDVTLQKITPADAISYRKALSIAAKSFSTAENGEFHVRLICENQNFYWFCAVARENGSEAVLLSATDGKIIAKKTFPSK